MAEQYTAPLFYRVGEEKIKNEEKSHFNDSFPVGSRHDRRLFRFQTGYTKAQARDQYLKVDANAENFGFERVQAIIDYRGGAIGIFIEEKGYPDYLYEYEKEDKAGDEREFCFLLSG